MRVFKSLKSILRKTLGGIGYNNVVYRGEFGGMGNMIEIQTKLKFSGHETFPFRYPWPAKGVQGIQRDPELFARDEAIVELGVGKNMVKSIRHWCESLDLVEKADSRSKTLKATTLGSRIFQEGGWDPYLEYVGTLWLLHWQLAKSSDAAATWYLCFGYWGAETLSREGLVDWILRIAQDKGTRATRGSIKRDVDVFLRSYCPAQGRRDVPIEESFDSPLVELGLIQEVQKGIFVFRRGPKPSLPNEIFLYALLEYWREHAQERESLSFERLLYGAGSPGAVFKLTENVLAERLERLPKDIGLQFDETAGMRNVYGSPDTSFEKRLALLGSYYSESRGEAEQ